jgi:hypothetical protein
MASKKETLCITFFCTTLMIGVLAFLLKTVYEKNTDPMGGWIRRADTPEIIKCLTLFIYLGPYPTDTGFCQCNEIKSGKEQFGKVLLSGVPN